MDLKNCDCNQQRMLPNNNNNKKKIKKSFVKMQLLCNHQDCRAMGLKGKLSKVSYAPTGITTSFTIFF